MPTLIRMVVWNFSLVAIFNTLDMKFNYGEGYRFSLGDRVLFRGQPATIYHRWRGPMGDAYYCIQYHQPCNFDTDTTCDLKNNELIPLTKAAQVLLSKSVRGTNV